MTGDDRVEKVTRNLEVSIIRRNNSREKTTDQSRQWLNRRLLSAKHVETITVRQVEFSTVKGVLTWGRRCRRASLVSVPMANPTNNCKMSPWWWEAIRGMVRIAAKPKILIRKTEPVPYNQRVNTVGELPSWWSMWVIWEAIWTWSCPSPSSWWWWSLRLWVSWSCFSSLFVVSDRQLDNIDIRSTRSKGVTLSNCMMISGVKSTFWTSFAAWLLVTLRCWIEGTHRWCEEAVFSSNLINLLLLLINQKGVILRIRRTKVPT